MRTIFSSSKSSDVVAFRTKFLSFLFPPIYFSWFFLSSYVMRLPINSSMASESRSWASVIASTLLSQVSGRTLKSFLTVFPLGTISPKEYISLMMEVNLVCISGIVSPSAILNSSYCLFKLSILDFLTCVVPS